MTDKRALLVILRKTEAALQAATMAFADGVASDAPEAELLALAHDVGGLQLAVKHANAAVPWHLKAKFFQRSKMGRLASVWSSTV
jgi:predicted HD phosphohydrolase